jgi:nitrite reductase (NADH) small subunit/3-phenylpropionate/trans-cinnamate dioxygenase ferredoxin subunit
MVSNRAIPVKDGARRRSRAREPALVTSEAFVPVGPVAEIVPGSSKTVVVEGREIAVFNVGGTFYAIENYCPHQGASLAEGWLDGTTITCPWHAWCFNLTDGTMTLGAFARVDPYDVRVEEGQVSVSSRPRRPEVT